MCRGYQKTLVPYSAGAPRPAAETWSPSLSEPGGITENERLRRIARFQKWVIWAVVVNIPGGLLGILAAVLPPAAALPLLAVVFAITIYILVAVYQLARYVYRPASAVFISLLMFVPLVSLITLLVLNQQATSILEARGIPVGLLGADPRKLPTIK